jgi:tRNA G18 (ribose-2'-O)-methylase SpoU
MKILLDAPEDFSNVCLLSRTLEVFGVECCYIYDPHALIRPRYGKSRRRKISSLSAGAFFRVAFELVENPETFLASTPGRNVATVPDRLATPLTEFAFRTDDTIVFGSESQGVRPDLLALCDACVTVPQRGLTESLNLTVAMGIVLFEYFQQTENLWQTSSGASEQTPLQSIHGAELYPR